MIEEMWAPVPGFEDWYEISSLGTVRSWVGGGGRVNEHRRRRVPLTLKPSRTRGGYLCINLGGKRYRLNRLVLIAFGEGDRPDMEAAHLNGIHTDNRLDNLGWKTPKENAADKISHGTHRVGPEGANAKLTYEQVEMIRDLYAQGDYSYRRLGELFGVHPMSIGRYIRREVYR